MASAFVWGEFSISSLSHVVSNVFFAETRRLACLKIDKGCRHLAVVGDLHGTLAGVTPVTARIPSHGHCVRIKIYNDIFSSRPGIVDADFFRRGEASGSQNDSGAKGFRERPWLIPCRLLNPNRFVSIFLLHLNYVSRTEPRRYTLFPHVSMRFSKQSAGKNSSALTGGFGKGWISRSFQIIVIQHLIP